MPAPIALFVYNRLLHTQRTVEALRANSLAAQSELTIFSDAARNAGHRDAVEEVRRYVRAIASVPGFARVRVVERDANMGLARSVVEGVTQLCRESGCSIVLEDDLVTAPTFLEFMNAGLERYEHVPEVMQISGHMFPVSLPKTIDAMFLPFVTTWGWATWARAWSKYGDDPELRRNIASTKSLRLRFDLDGSYNYSAMLDDQNRAKIDSWGITWYLSLFKHAGLVLYPRTSLIQNIGWDGSGTHRVRATAVATSAGTPHLRTWPSEVVVDQQVFAILRRYFRNNRGWRRQLRKFLMKQHA